MKKTKCNICGCEISNNNIKKHLLSHETHPKYQENKIQQKLGITYSLSCKYCNKLCKNENSLVQHECRCKQNPNRIKIVNNLDSYNHNPNHHAWNKGLTKETDARVLKSSITYRENFLLGKHKVNIHRKTEEEKEIIRKQKLELCAKQGTNLCGKGKRGYYKGYYCQSSWELAYVIYQLEHNVAFIRNKEGFKYILEGIERSYFPDFYLIDDDTYVEIKGYYDNKTKEKEKQFPANKKLQVLKYEEMQPILDYVVSKYGKKFIELYE